MLIALSKSDDGAQTFLLLGLSRENIKRLTIFGEPIKITRKSHGDAIPEGLTISIMFGETEKEMAQALKNAGVITPDTKQTIDPRLK